MGRSSEPDREDDPVSRLRRGQLDRRDREWLATSRREEVSDVAASRRGRVHGLLDAAGVQGRRRDDHERLPRPVHGVVDNKLDDAAHLGVGGFDATRDRVGQPRAVLDEREAEARVPEQGARPGHRADAPLVEAPVDELREVLASCPVASRERVLRQELCEARVDRFADLVGVPQAPGVRAVCGWPRDSDGERRRVLRDGVAKRDNLVTAADRPDALRD
ncbi:hypothetical protein ACFPRL_27610 [Pseudoclavibacter helvolus]